MGPGLPVWFSLSAVVLWSRAVRVDPGQEWIDGSSLEPDFSLAAESGHQTFSAEEEAFQFAARLQAGENIHLIVQRVFKSDDVAGVDDVFTSDVHFQNGSVGVEEEVTGSGCLEQNQAFATEEALGSLPSSGQFDAVGVGDEGSALNQQGVHIEVVVDSVAGGSRGEDDFAWSSVSGECVDDHALATEGSSDRFSEAALQSSFERDGRIHCRHRGWLGENPLALFELDRDQAEVGALTDFELNVAIH